MYGCVVAAFFHVQGVGRHTHTHSLSLRIIQISCLFDIHNGQITQTGAAHIKAVLGQGVTQKTERPLHMACRAGTADKKTQPGVLTLGNQITSIPTKLHRQRLYLVGFAGPAAPHTIPTQDEGHQVYA